MSDRKHPMQAIEWDGQGVIRFRKNEAVRYLVDVVGLNELVLHDFPREDREQLMQLIGYSVSAFGSLDETSKESQELADAAAERLADATGGKDPGVR